MFLARRHTPEGARFDLAHELGHLLPHSSDGPHSGAREEDEANQFAADFLIPPGIVHAHLRLHASLDDILRLKTALKVSAMAMLRAAYHHGKLSEREYRSHLTSLSARGFRTSEPGSALQYERSRVFDYVLSPDGGASIALPTKHSCRHRTCTRSCSAPNHTRSRAPPRQQAPLSARYSEWCTELHNQPCTR
ncbi:ImmA/IrrE family metallo-endopeptidase [Corynebacterium wankanglinii]|uniref:ImmA/IrrE family metallo-endopeptidase n=1 Tax=Corynebacterium wankanglinii TaxID=2735136 RepID=UPI0039A6D67F